MPKAVKTKKKPVKNVEPVVHALRAYELTVVVSGAVKAEKRADVISSLKAMAEDSNGKVEKIDEWGLKDLAYPINHQWSGWYVFFLLKLPSSAIAKLQMNLGREKTILRHLLVTP
jgi:small subunit ribosomal protein S6